MLQGSHLLTYVSFVRRVLQDAPRAPRVPLANLTDWYTSITPGVNTLPDELVGD
jgi:hypothetical protein